MAATITTKFRLENANTFIKSIANDSVYIMLGKSDAWSANKDTSQDSPAPTPLDVQLEENDMWQNAIALKKLGASDAINVVPRYNWVSGTRYVGWDDFDAAIFTKRFYVLNENYDLFKCLKAPLDPLITSTNAPAITASPHAFSTPDGYIWKYMGKISTPNVTKFMTVNYMPVKTITLLPGVDASSLSADEATQYAYQTSCATDTSGKIYRYVVTNGGSGYSTQNPPTVTISGNGSGAAATAVVVNGIITAINVTGESAMMDATGNGPQTYRNNCGIGYTSAYVTIASPVAGVTATARAILSPKNGHGTDQTRELGGFYVETNVTLTGAEGAGADFITGANFRQIALVKNPLNFNTAVISNTATLSALKTMRLTAAPSGGTLASGDYITGSSSTACAFVDSYALEDTTHIIRYHQNDKTGYGTFSSGEAITSFGDQSATIASGGLGNPEVKPCSGDIMFIENRAPITRAISQIEDIRLVIEF